MDKTQTTSSSQTTQPPRFNLKIILAIGLILIVIVIFILNKSSTTSNISSINTTNSPVYLNTISAQQINQISGTDLIPNTSKNLNLSMLAIGSQLSGFSPNAITAAKSVIYNNSNRTEIVQIVLEQTKNQTIAKQDYLKAIENNNVNFQSGSYHGANYIVFGVQPFGKSNIWMSMGIVNYDLFIIQALTGPNLNATPPLQMNQQNFVGIVNKQIDQMLNSSGSSS